ncbi:MAG TPA: retroviral-like aspartic protease family protein [Allosphingosinicella sp.]|nr:retroviral-like aspartic protease family protein [Allosphingosinicella sp.]
MTRRFLAPLLAAALACAAPAFAERIRLLPTGHWAATVRINGEGPFEFIVDTAASVSAVFPNLRERLALAGGGTRAVAGASGTQAFGLFRLERIDIDGRSARGVTAVGLDAIPDDRISAGIVGADLLSRFVAEFDLPGGQLRLHDPGTALAGPWGEVPFRLNGASFAVLEGQLDGRPVTMILDTGARRTIVNWRAAQAAGIARDAADLVPSEPIGGATSHRTQAVRRDFASLATGPLTLSAARITIADLPVFAQLGLAGRPAMILGIDRLRHLRFAIDYPRRLLLFRQAP